MRSCRKERTLDNDFSRFGTFETLARRVRAALVAGVFAVTVGAAPIAAASDTEMAKDAGFGLGSALASLVYAPVKMAYAIGGVAVGGLAFAFSGGDAEVARTVLRPSVLGDYVITTEHLSGERSIGFFGEGSPSDGYDDYETYGDSSLGDASADVASAPEGW